MGSIPLQVRIGDYTSLVNFFVINAPVQYNALLGRDWIHTNLCVPSSLHQCIMLWHNEKVKVIEADPRPFQYDSHAAEIFADAYYYADGDTYASNDATGCSAIQADQYDSGGK